MIGWILLAILACLLLCSFLRVGVQAEYTGQKLSLQLKLGRLCILRYPQKKRKAAAEKRTPSQDSSQSRKGKDWSLRDHLRFGEDLSLENLVHMGKVFGPVFWELAKRGYAKMRIDRLHVRVTVGGRDPADVVMQYGQLYALLGSVWNPLIEHLHVVDGWARVELDFEQTNWTAEGIMVFSLRLGALVWLTLGMGRRMLQAWRVGQMPKPSQAEDRKAA